MMFFSGRLVSPPPPLPPQNTQTARSCGRRNIRRKRHRVRPEARKNCPFNSQPSAQRMYRSEVKEEAVKLVRRRKIKPNRRRGTRTKVRALWRWRAQQIKPHEALKHTVKPKHRQRCRNHSQHRCQQCQQPRNLRLFFLGRNARRELLIHLR